MQALLSLLLLCLAHSSLVAQRIHSSQPTPQKCLGDINAFWSSLRVVANQTHHTPIVSDVLPILPLGQQAILSCHNYNSSECLSDVLDQLSDIVFIVEDIFKQDWNDFWRQALDILQSTYDISQDCL